MVWLAEPPTAPNQQITTMLIAQGQQAPTETKTDSTDQKKRVAGVCEIVNGAGESADEVKTEISNAFYARLYMNHYENKDWFINNPQTTIIQPPQHGRLAEGWYYPDKGYFGDDAIIAKVKENGVAVEVRFFIHVLEYNEADPYYYCGEAVRQEFLRQGQGNSWKISSFVTPSLDDLAWNQALGIRATTVNFVTLPDALLSQTSETGANATISLDIKRQAH